MAVILGNLAGSFVGVFIVSALIAAMLMVVVHKHTFWERMRYATPLGLIVALVISFVSVVEYGVSDAEWPLMALTYSVSAVVWFCIALIASPKPGAPLNLIIGTKMDGFGRVRVLLIGGISALIFMWGVTLSAITVTDTPAPRGEFFAECMTWSYIDRSTPTSARIECNHAFERREQRHIDAQLRSMAFTIFPIFVGLIAWIFAGLVGWMYRGFAEKPEQSN